MSFTLILFFPGHFHTHTITHGHDQQWDLLLIYMTCLLAADSFKFNKSLPFRTPRPHLELLSDTRMVSRARIAHTVRKKSTIWAAQWSALQISRQSVQPICALCQLPSCTCMRCSECSREFRSKCLSMKSNCMWKIEFCCLVCVVDNLFVLPIDDLPVSPYL